MAIWMDAGMRNGEQVSGGCDSVADVPNLPAYAQEHNLKVGSNFLCISDASVYMMKSDGSFSKLGG